MLLVSSALAMAAAAWFAAHPVENPRVQDCGAPLAFVVRAERDLEVPIGVPGAAADAPALRTQEPCSSLVVPPLERSGMFFGVGVALGLAGAVLGLLDDRVRLRRSPRFEALLRPRPPAAPPRALDPVPVPLEDLVPGLPALEPAQVWLLVLGALVGLVGLPVAVGIDAARTALDEVGPFSVGLLASLAVCCRVVAAATRAVGYSRPFAGAGALDASPPAGGSASTPAAPMGLGHWLGESSAADWAARVRPEMGVGGLDVRHLVVGSGLAHDVAAARVRQQQAVSALVHVAVLVVVGRIVGGPDSPTPTSTSFRVLAGAVAVAVLIGLARVPRRLRAMAVTPDAAAWRGILSTGAAGRTMVFVVGVGAQALLESTMLAVAVAACGGQLDAPTAVFVWLLAVTGGAAGPLPAGVGVTDALLVVLLWRYGVGPGEAVAATFLVRLAGLWAAMPVGAWSTRRSLRTGGF